MRQYNADNLVVHPSTEPDSAVVVEVTPEKAGWTYISFQVRRLANGQVWEAQTGEQELALVPLSGSLHVESDQGQWAVGGRANVFSGLPHALYLPRRTAFRVTTAAACEFAVAWAPTDQDHAPRLVTPDDVAVEIRGGDHATRQINSILPPGFPCHRLVLVEVYTPGGNWSSYPPHKHDVHKTAPDGGVLEADLEEVYYYKLDRPEGYAFQRIYTAPESPLHQAGYPIDAVVLARNDDAVLVPEGYHPVSSPPGYTTYYLNVLAGSAQSLANSEDPRYAWVKETYQTRDTRLPIYDVTRAGIGGSAVPDPARTYDVIAMGRSSIDLYSTDIGAPFEAITGFAAYVGGCPTNISVGAQRLGLRAALLTAVGDDQVGSFILHFLDREGVATAYIPRKPGRRSSAVVLGIQPPDRFPLTFYRDNCADIALTIDDVLAAPIADSRVLLITGTGLSQEPSRSATFFAAEQARQAGTRIVLDIDFRPDQWHDPRAFGVTLRAVLHLVDIVLGTEDEINAAMLTDPAQVHLTHSQVSDARVSGDLDASIEALLALGPAVLLQKRGAAGARVHLAAAGGPPSRQDVPGFPVAVVNILGAGDAFAAGFLSGYVQGWDWYRAVRLANACGAILVTQPGCANFMPSMDEVTRFIAEHGGW